MRKAIIILIFILNSFPAVSQENNNSKFIVYIDLGCFLSGSFGTYGIGLNLEYMLSRNFSVKTGLNFCRFGGGDMSGGGAFAIPLMLNYMTPAKNKFESGLGLGLVFQENKSHLLPAASLGYRYQPPGNGVLFRAGIGIPGNFYPSLLSVGYCF
jgi:hypothetical protein